MKHKLYIASGSAPPPQWKILGAHLILCVVDSRINDKGIREAVDALDRSSNQRPGLITWKTLNSVFVNVIHGTVIKSRT
jgi:hypothetical protein